ncbi:tryptophan-rich sensory protein [Devosia crocina]|uniref:Tryptophan-rich sensory protein n=1 Tax=Devosia crocina TaxID=429728 RepID=A0A1I7NL27_9HYPH|nr:TspO/MBR family protein [Devosia crocina]SFV35384.1 tryptophan-rich sensory protein [Devosia crocina]
MSATTTDHHTPRSWIVLVAFLVVVVGVGALIGTQTQPGTWYESLTKPPFNPPNWIFGPVWFTLYVMIAIAGWRSFMESPTGTPMKFWYAQMLLNWAWSPVWFAGEMIWPAFAIIVAMWLMIVGFIAANWRRDRLAAILFIPYLAWVSFATLLNLSIGILN